MYLSNNCTCSCTSSHISRAHPILNIMKLLIINQLKQQFHPDNLIPIYFSKKKTSEKIHKIIHLIHFDLSPHRPEPYICTHLRPLFLHYSLYVNTMKKKRKKIGIRNIIDRFNSLLNPVFFSTAFTSFSLCLSIAQCDILVARISNHWTTPMPIGLLLFLSVSLSLSLLFFFIEFIHIRIFYTHYSTGNV